MVTEPNEALVGRIIAVDMINWLLLDIVQWLDPSLAADEKFKTEFAEATDGVMVDSLLDWDNEILAAYSDAMMEFERNLFSEDEA